MSWVNLDDVYVNQTGGTIAGDLSVNGTLTVNDGKGTNTTYNVANEITTLRDSVSQVNKLYSSNAWYIAVMSGFICIYALEVTTGTGSWETSTCPYTLPEEYCPSISTTAPAVTENGNSWTGYISVTTAGKIFVGNYGNRGASDKRRGFLMYPISM